jgi:hypothetical protein
MARRILPQGINLKTKSGGHPGFVTMALKRSVEVCLAVVVQWTKVFDHRI